MRKRIQSKRQRVKVATNGRVHIRKPDETELKLVCAGVISGFSGWRLIGIDHNSVPYTKGTWRYYIHKKLPGKVGLKDPRGYTTVWESSRIEIPYLRSQQWRKTEFRR